MCAATDRTARVADAATRSVWSFPEQGAASLIGSCVVLTVGVDKYVVTAAHVIDQGQIAPLFVAVDKDWVPLDGDIRCTRAPNGQRKLDKTDLAIMPVFGKDAVKLGAGCAAHQDTVAALIGKPLYTMLGYPLTVNKNSVERFSGRVRPRSVAVTTNLASESALVSMAGSQATHLAVNYPQRRLRAADGHA